MEIKSTTTMAARHPLYLPPELAFEIAKHLDGYTLLRVSKVSHLWRKAALSSLDNMSLAGALSAFRTAVVNANHEALICFASHIQRNKRTSSATGCMALTWACTTTCPEAVRILVPYASMPCRHQRSGNGNDINAWDEPLLEAMRQQDPGPLAVLFQNGAPRDRIWFCGLTAQGLALAHSSRGSPTPESPKRFLHAAISRGFPAAAKYVLNRLRDDPGRLDAVLNQEQQHGDLPLYAAASHGHANIVRILLEYRVNVDQVNSAKCQAAGRSRSCGERQNRQDAP
ncbi:hypothetical protein ASPSYDRAFT_900718 [Aspergillus sydowii CBS 593.65]|uniref:F-box domain-containing protein n=1 Tax=Aspergillus sydowii CBS 593.65 TaxID=1036612 RepID=A0A1L9TK61_9EURO|nr:uncharacterized protein ASPSYDRAFT_900718 [Aspergillus sydowii CBS 593.65]OJJ59807.1 hypothetical protein ASPSYDRAFT_900718 [Aspergillus sydowii CBS 593.65]